MTRPAYFIATSKTSEQELVARVYGLFNLIVYFAKLAFGSHYLFRGRDLGEYSVLMAFRGQDIRGLTTDLERGNKGC